MRTLKIAAVVLITLSVLAFALRGFTVPIEFGNAAARDLATKNILAYRNKTIEQLEEVVKRDVNDPNKNQEVGTAMTLLGQLRADDAAPLLASHLSFRAEENWKRGMTHLLDMGDFYPAVGALVSIGIPSLDALLYRAANTDDRKDDRLTDYVLVSVIGKQPAIAFVNDTINDQRENQQKQRLNALLVSLQKYPSARRDITIRLSP